VWLYLCLREHFVWMSSIPITGLLRIRSWCHVQFLHLLNKQLFNNIFNHSSDLLLLCSVLKRMVYELYSRVGRFLTKIWFWIRVPLEYIHLYVKKIPKTAKKKVCWSNDVLRKGQALYKSPKFFSHNMGFMGIKRRRI
jgi:hypothetical protein